MNYDQWRQWAKTAPLLDVTALIEVLEDEAKKRIDDAKLKTLLPINDTHTHRCQYCGKEEECDDGRCEGGELSPCSDCIKKGYDR